MLMNEPSTAVTTFATAFRMYNLLILFLQSTNMYISVQKYITVTCLRLVLTLSVNRIIDLSSAFLLAFSFPVKLSLQLFDLGLARSDCSDLFFIILCLSL